MIGIQCAAASIAATRCSVSAGRASGLGDRSDPM